MKGHKFLKSTGILMIVAAAFSIIAGVFVGGLGVLAAGLGAASGLTFAYWAALFLTLVGGICQLIAGIKGVDSVKAMGSREAGSEEFAIEVQPGIDIRRDLFERLSQRGWPLLASKPLAMSLEDIFINLTLHQDGGVN